MMDEKIVLDFEVLNLGVSLIALFTCSRDLGQGVHLSTYLKIDSLPLSPRQSMGGNLLHLTAFLPTALDPFTFVRIQISFT